MSYVLDAGRTAHGMDAQSERWLNHKTIHYGEVAGTGKAQICFDQVSIEKATEYAAEDAAYAAAWGCQASSSQPDVDRLETLQRRAICVLSTARERDVGILGGVFGRLLDRDLVEADLRLAGAGDLAVMDGLMVEPALRLGSIPCAVLPASST